MKSSFVIFITVALIEFTLSAKITPANGSKHSGSVATPEQSTEADVDIEFSDEQTDGDDSNEQDDTVDETSLEQSVSTPKKTEKVAVATARPAKTLDKASSKTSANTTPETVLQETSANITAEKASPKSATTTPQHASPKTSANTTPEKESPKPATTTPQHASPKTSAYTTPKKPVAHAATPKSGHSKTVPARKTENDDEEAVAVPQPSKKRKSSARPSQGERARPQRKNSAARTKSSPTVNSHQPLDLNELASALQKLPPNVVRSAKQLLAGLQNTFEDFPAIQSYFGHLSSLLGSNDFGEYVPEAGYGFPSPSYMGWAMPANAMFTELGGLGIQAGGEAARMAGRMADSIFQNMKEGNELVRTNTGFVRRVPVLGQMVDPVHDMVDAGLDVGHSVFGSNAGTVGAQVSEIGQHLRRKGVDRRLSRSRHAKPQSDSPLTY